MSPIVVPIHCKVNKWCEAHVYLHCQEFQDHLSIRFAMTPTLVSTFDPAQQFAPCLLELFAQLRLHVKTKLVWPSVAKPSPMRTRGAPLYAQSCRLLERGCWTRWETQSYRFLHSSNGNLLFRSVCRSEHINLFAHLRGCALHRSLADGAVRHCFIDLRCWFI